MSGILLCYVISLRTCGTIVNRAHPSVVRLNRPLELNSWSTRGGAVYLAIVIVYGI